MKEAPYPFERLCKGYFAARRTDRTKAAELLDGTLHLGDYKFDVFESSSYDRADRAPRAQQLVLHSLRWADPLRRSGAEVAGGEQAWLRIYNAWSKSKSAADQNSAAWAPYVCEQRATTIALQASTHPDSPYLSDHLRILQQTLDETAGALRRLAILRVLLALSSRSGLVPNEREALAKNSVGSTFTGNGYCIAADLSEVCRAFTEWEAELEAASMLDARRLLEERHSEEFWVHAYLPAGDLVQFGNKVPPLEYRGLSPVLDYARSAGATGEPPRNLRFVDPEGVISLRSGWGETEKDAAEETHVSFMVGPNRGKEAHQDLARLTYTSQGINWLTDPLDVSLTEAEYHSVIALPNSVYRRDAEARLTAQYQRPDVEGYIAEIDVYYRVNWKRHVIFARTANYVAVQDTLSAPVALDARLQWIVGASHDIYRVEHGFNLVSGDKRVSLTFLGTNLKDSVVEPVRDHEGRIVARRVSVPVSVDASVPTRITTTVTDIAVASRHSVDIASADNESTVVSLHDSYISEHLVITPEYSAIMPTDMSPRNAVARTNQIASDGELSDTEVLALRTDVRRAIESAKMRVRGEGESLGSRRDALVTLLDYVGQRRIHGLRDHGLRSSLIDIAGNDLLATLSASGVLGNTRRSPLVQWGGAPMLHAQYGVPVLTSVSSTTFPDDRPESFIWSVDAGQLVPSCYIDDSPGEILVVYFHGATDRTRIHMPRYERLRSFAKLNLGPRMFFSDPGLDLDSRMILSWYVGTEEVELPLVMARMILTYANVRQVNKVLLVGNSGGGFAALQVAAHLEGTRVLVFHPQISIDRYVPRLAKAAHWASFGRGTVGDVKEFSHRMDVIKSYERFDFDQHVHYVQNVGDAHHVEAHFVPFREAFGRSRNSDMLKVELPDFGPGHRLPPPDQYLEYVRSTVAAPGDEWSLRGLRSL